MNGRVGMSSAFAAAVIWCTPIPAAAVVSGSPHDLAAQGYDVPKEGGDCISCHLPASVDRRNYLKDVPPSLKGYDSQSILCFSCHDGTTLVDPAVDASYTAFHPLSHGYDLTGKSCLACHNPHDNTKRPFLVVGLDELCQSCHIEEAKTKEGEEPFDINHPVLTEFPPGGSESIPLEVDQAFQVAYPAAYPAAAGRTSGEAHWDLGGHLNEGSTGLVDCITCHAVHGDEESPPKEKLLTLDPVNEIANELCEACHRGGRGDGLVSPPFPNPGGTSTARTYHPADDNMARGQTTMETRKPPAWPFGSDPTGAILCTTCHVVHGAQWGSSLLRKTESLDFCDECHETLSLEYHHPLSSNRCSENLPPPALGGEVGKMYCSTCHRAHNAGLGEADESLFVPLLRQQTDTEGFCATCHPPDNPTCGTNPGYRASHFLGDPSLPETYSDSSPPIWKEAWPESGLYSTYGGPNGLAILCLSCHSFKKGAILSGDDGKSSHLLARAGNMVEWVEGGESEYLCTGCHSANPGTGGSGRTHPTMDADISNLDDTPQPPVTVTPGGKIDCDSCHRSHEAVTGGGVYILEVVTGDNIEPTSIHPVIDYTPLCHKCHGAKY